MFGRFIIVTILSRHVLIGLMFQHGLTDSELQWASRITILTLLLPSGVCCYAPVFLVQLSMQTTRRRFPCQHG